MDIIKQLYNENVKGKFYGRAYLQNKVNEYFNDNIKLILTIFGLPYDQLYLVDDFIHTNTVNTCMWKVPDDQCNILKPEILKHKVYDGHYILCDGIAKLFFESNNDVTGLLSQYCYYKDFSILLYLKPVEEVLKYIQKMNPIYFSTCFYQMIIGLIDYLYSELSKELLSLLNLDSNIYIISYNKIYNKYDSNRFLSSSSIVEDEFNSLSTNPNNHDSSKVINIFEPFIGLNVFENKFYNYITFDLLDKDRSDKYKWPMMLFPFSNKIVSGFSNHKLKGNIDDYELNHHLPTLYHDEDIIKVSDIIPMGYIPSNIIIGNLFNHLYITIYNKVTDKSFIIQYDVFGNDSHILDKIDEDYIYHITNQDTKTYNSTFFKINHLFDFEMTMA